MQSSRNGGVEPTQMAEMQLLQLPLEVLLSLQGVVVVARAPIRKLLLQMQAKAQRLRHPQ